MHEATGFEPIACPIGRNSFPKINFDLLAHAPR